MKTKIKNLFKKSVVSAVEFDEAMREQPKRFEESIGMSQMAREELVDRVRAMDQEEMELVVEQIPIDICMNRIIKEIERAKEFEANIKKAVELSGRGD